MEGKLKICIVGDGGWGTALGLLMLSNGYKVTMWGPFEDYLEEIRRTGENSRYLAGLKTPPELEWISDAAREIGRASCRERV